MSEAAGEYRLVVPGLTSLIGEELHNLLLLEGVHSFLVIGRNRVPDEDKRWLFPVSLTTKRIGSFVAVVDPGALSDIQDSIRGTGGAIRGVTFSEEWPWIDNGSEAFRFAEPFLDRLFSAWSLDLSVRPWFNALIADALLESTRRDAGRNAELLERILGRFEPGVPIAIEDVRERFLLHCGIPQPEEVSQSYAQLIRSTQSLVRGIIDRFQREPDLRTHVLTNIDSRNADAHNVREAVNTFFDGLANPASLESNILALRQCWGPPEARTRNWTHLTAGVLRQLFEIHEPCPIRLDCKIQPGGGTLVSSDGRSAAGLASNDFMLNVTYEVPAEEFAQGQNKFLLAIRTRQITELTLLSPVGQVDIPINIEDLQVSYKGRVPVKASIVMCNQIRGEDRVVIHCCGEKRSAFVVTTPFFWVDDAERRSEDDLAPERRYNVDVPLRLHLFTFERSQPSVIRDDGDVEQLVFNNDVWETAESLDIFGNPAGQCTYECYLGDRSVSLTFQAEDIERGEFTLEDELRQLLMSARIDGVTKILGIYRGLTQDAYSRLGGLNNETRRRTRLARCFEDRLGWRPVLADLLEQGGGPETACGDFATAIGRLEAGAISSVTLPNDAVELLSQYAEKRDSFRQIVLASVMVSGALEHPDYATYPFYLAEDARRRQPLELALIEYLAAYGNVQTYLIERQRQLSWPQAFILNYLDCIVQWREDSSKNAFFLIGPWHPLIVAKRFLVQHALVLRAKRMVDAKDKRFKQLVSLLAQTAGFHWHPALQADDVALESAYVTPTSDPGWHFAFKSATTDVNFAGSPSVLLHSILRSLRDNLGLEARIDLPASGAMVGTVLGSYMRTFPSKRHVGVYFPAGFRGKDEVATADQLLHRQDGPAPAGLQLNGGLSLLFASAPALPEDVTWVGPPLKVFKYEDRSTCLAEQHPDIQFAQAGNRHSFVELTEAHSLPRGKEYGIVFDAPVSRLTRGQSFIPQSVAEEWDLMSHEVTSVAGMFARNCGLACKLCGVPRGVVHATSLPLRQETTWTVVPGAVLDPAIFVGYVNDGRGRQAEERALWDYRVSLTKANTSFFVLSTIPAAFRSAVNGIFDISSDLASGFVTELGQIGLAIAGEAMKSGRHALGSVGVVGAVRLFRNSTTGIGPLHWTRHLVSFLLPVDSFRDVLEGNLAPTGELDDVGGNRRADLLVVVLRLPVSGGPLVVQAASVECKFTLGTFPAGNVHSALEQARTTTDQVERLCRTAQTDAGIPERLALLQLVRFGLRITASEAQDKDSGWPLMERLIYQYILRGECEYYAAKSDAILVSTEISLLGSAEINRSDAGLWVRLNKQNWPGVFETASIATIRQAIDELFDLTAASGPEVPDLTPQSTLFNPVQVDRALPVASLTEPDDSIIETSIEQLLVEEVNLSPDSTTSNVETTIENEFHSDSGVVLRPVLVGVDLGRRSVYFDPHSPVDRLDNANVMVTGSSGKGKTQLLKYLVTSIRHQGANALILDFKNDFASDSYFVREAQMESILVAFDGMPFNPLIPYPIKDPRSSDLFIQCAQHIAGVAAVLRRTYGLGAQQEAAVKNAIRQAFTEVGVNPASTIAYEPTMLFPDLARVGTILEQTNVAAYNRLDPLFTLGLFREQYIRASFAMMVSHSAAIDFSQIPSDALKNALAELVVLSAHSYFNSQPHCGTLKQVFVVDEAHRILGADYLERFTLECRAYGVSLLLSSQYPSQFPQGISSSLTTKIIHGNDRDVDRVRDITNLLGANGREAEIADLGMFEAIFSNKHFRNVIIRTITYPLYLVLKALDDSTELSRDEIGVIEGLDTQKLSVANIVRQLERLGLCEAIDGGVRLIGREG